MTSDVTEKLRVENAYENHGKTISPTEDASDKNSRVIVVGEKIE